MNKDQEPISDQPPAADSPRPSTKTTSSQPQKKKLTIEQQNAIVDEASRQSFPASDAPSFTPLHVH